MKRSNGCTHEGMQLMAQDPNAPRASEAAGTSAHSSRKEFRSSSPRGTNVTPSTAILPGRRDDGMSVCDSSQFFGLSLDFVQLVASAAEYYTVACRALALDSQSHLVL